MTILTKKNIMTLLGVTLLTSSVYGGPARLVKAAATLEERMTRAFREKGKGWKEDATVETIFDNRLSVQTGKGFLNMEMDSAGNLMNRSSISNEFGPRPLLRHAEDQKAVPRKVLQNKPLVTEEGPTRIVTTINDDTVPTKYKHQLEIDIKDKGIDGTINESEISPRVFVYEDWSQRVVPARADDATFNSAQRQVPSTEHVVEVAQMVQRSTPTTPFRVPGRVEYAMPTERDGEVVIDVIYWNKKGTITQQTYALNENTAQWGKKGPERISTNINYFKNEPFKPTGATDRPIGAAAVK